MLFLQLIAFIYFAARETIFETISMPNTNIVRCPIKDILLLVMEFKLGIKLPAVLYQGVLFLLEQSNKRFKVICSAIALFSLHCASIVDDAHSINTMQYFVMSQGT